MVKHSKPVKLGRNGKPKGRPGKKPAPEIAKSDRVIMRAHPDLVSIVQKRADEKGLTRSKYLEQLLVGFMQADPRNPKMSAIGRIDQSAPTPLQQQLANPMRFAERWMRFAAAQSAIFGSPPPQDWTEEEDRFWQPVELNETDEEKAFEDLQVREGLKKLKKK